MFRKIVCTLLALLCICFALTPLKAEGETPAEEKPSAYKHDPMKNPKAAEDIIVNSDAVYGYSPSPDSVRLKQFVNAIDWTDPAQVEDAKQQRIEYHQSMDDLYKMIVDLLHQGKNVEEIARAVSQRRNEIRLESYKDDPEGLARVKQSNLETYGNEMGPTADSLHDKYGSWQTVLEKALSTNPGMDACLGLYDEYYDTYDLVEEAAKNPAEEPAKDQTYTVVKGDCLSKIAKRFLGSGKEWKKIWEANRDKIKNPDLIYPGQVLILP